MNEIYKQLTSVDIEQQKKIWDERGKGYYGEFLIFCNLYRYVIGNCKILMNLNIPVNNARTTEIDLLLIHETGLYVFEIKHYKGTIYGKDTDSIWTQYFRTAKNNKFRNPIEQNNYHIKAIESLFPNVPVRSMVVFTSDNCNIKVNNSNSNVDVCTLRDVQRIISSRFKNASNRFTLEDIDNIFNQLSQYSPMKENITIDGIELSFFSWVQPIIAELEVKKSEVVHEKCNLVVQEEKLKEIKNRGRFLNVIVGILCVIISIISIIYFQANYNKAIQLNNSEIKKIEQELENSKQEEILSLKQKNLKLEQELEKLENVINEDINNVNSYVKVLNADISSIDNNGVTFTATITNISDMYGIVIQENAKYVVETSSGNVYEYAVFGDHLRYSYESNKLVNKNATGNLVKIRFNDVCDMSEISYIKLVGVRLFKADISQADIKGNLELELYQAA